MKTIYFHLLLLLFVLGACNKEKEIIKPVLEVKVSTPSIKAGEELIFSLKGDAGFVSFYSGKPLNNYDFKDGRILGSGITKLSFDSYTYSGYQPNQLTVMVSTDFNGIFNILDLLTAHWTDITSRYTLATTENSWSAGGNVDITDIIEKGKPLYIAFKYTAQPKSLAGDGKIWKVRNLSLTSQTDIANSTLADLVTSGWKLVYSENAVVDPTRFFIATTALSFRANASPKDDVYHEVWIVSKAFSIGDKDIGPDRAIPIKNFTQSWVTEWKQIYTIPGTYKATFIGSNSNINGDYQVVKQVDITVIQ